MLDCSFEIVDEPSVAGSGKKKKKQRGGQWIIDCIEATHLAYLTEDLIGIHRVVFLQEEFFDIREQVDQEANPTKCSSMERRQKFYF